MDPNDVADEITTRLDTIAGLRCFGYPPPTVVPPAAIVSYPERIEFDATYGRGMDRIPAWPVLIIDGKATDRTARERIYEYAAATGTKSVKAVLESGTYTSFDTIRVVDCAFDVVTIASVDYISALFTLDIAGRGTS
jgi:hypothetical protein